MRTPPSCLLLAAVLASACHRDIPSLSPLPAAAAPVRPRFLPPVDALLTETVHTSLRRASGPGVQEAEVTLVSRFAAEPDAWLLTQRVTRSRLLQDGQPVHSLVEAVLERAELRIRLAADGTYVRLTEPEAARGALRELAPRELDVSALERLFEPDALEARTREEWEVKYGGVYGRGLVPGQRAWAVGTLAVGGREVTYLLERTFTGIRPCARGEALVFALRCFAQPGATSPPGMHDTLRLAGSPEVTPGVECAGEQWLGQERFLPIRRELTFRVTWEAETWTWESRSALESVGSPEEERR